MSEIEVRVVWEPKFRDSLRGRKGCEPYVKLFDDYQFSLNDVDEVLCELSDYLDRDDIPDFGVLGVDEESFDCEYCGCYGSGLVFDNSSGINSVCSSCVEELVTILSSVDDKVYLTDYAGFFVKKVSGRDTNIPGGFNVGDIVIALGSGKRDRIKHDDSLLLFYKMDNFDSLKNDLEYSEKWPGAVHRDCASCGKNIKMARAHSLRNAKNKNSTQFFHYDCLNYIDSKIEEFEDEYKDLVVSRVL